MLARPDDPATVAPEMSHRIAALLAVLCFAVPFAGVARAQAAGDGRVIVLGFDGADARTISKLMEQGQLPNLKKLAEQGTFAPLGTINPAESPTAWASLNTGQNPGKTGVPGFVKRSLADLRGPGGIELRDAPMADFGHLIPESGEPIESFESTPIPTWSPMRLGLALGGLAFVGFLLLFALLLRVRAGIAIALSLVLGAVGVWGGMALRDYLPSRVPKMKNPLAATPFWEVASKHGVPSVVIDAAVAFDRAPVDHAKVLAGLGMPDARGEVNGFTIYTTDEFHFDRAPENKDTDTGSGGHKFRVDERNGVIESQIYGPVNFWQQDRLQRKIAAIDAAVSDPSTGYKKSLELNTEREKLDAELSEVLSQRTSQPVRVERKKDKVAVTLGHETQELVEGQWSDWYRLTFDLNPLLKIKAVTRAKVVHLASPHFELYVDTLHVDPAHPPFWQPLSQPADFSAELAHSCGPFETVGWACMNLPFKDGVVDPQTFMEDIEFTEKLRESLTYDRLAKDDWRIFMSCLSTPDRVQHMMYQYFDTEHPMYDAKAAAQTMTFFGETITFADAIPAIYRQVDRIVGKVLDEYVRPGDTLIVCGDHGFQTFRREVNLNNWLAEAGYLVLNPLERESDGKSLARYVDWSKTRAYALGLGGVYLNLKGREGVGVVEPADADALLGEIAQKFLAATDAKTGLRFGKGAYPVKQIHSGPYLDREPDMFLCFDAGYRVSWGTTAGGLATTKDADGAVIAAPVCSDNAKNWSGDHVSVDPSLVECIFFSNRKVEVPSGGISLLHIAPTVLALVGVPTPPECDVPALKVAQ